MVFDVLKNKRILNGLIDFSDVTFNAQDGYKLLDVFTITASYAMRWDKISCKYYNVPDYADGLYKFNEYDNPYSLNEGDIIYIPELQSLKNMYKTDSTINTTPIIVNNTPILVKSVDNSRLNFLIRKEQRTIPTIESNPIVKINQNGVYTLVKN